MTLPVRPEEFTRDVVERLLGAAAGSLASLDFEPVGTGQVCDSYRFRCVWSGAAPDHPATFIAKCPSADAISRQAAALFHLYDMEVGWYRDLANGGGVRCPGCLYAEISGDGSRFVLLLEDMAPAQQGDQLSGASLRQVETTLTEAAALHNIRPAAGFDAFGWLHHGEANAEISRQTVVPRYPEFRERFSGLLAPDILELGAAFVARLEGYLAREPAEATVTHGDMRLDNILFDDTGAVAALVDWQTCSLGNPANDVAYMIGTSFADADERQAQEERLVRGYLSRRGDPPAFEAFWEDYRAHAFSGFLMAINASLHVEQTARGDAMFAAMAERPARMAIDLDSLSLLPAP